ncbi:DUF3301 domain-containing protein [Thiopseudomonas alkaliphila]|uniref:DUF3301 domain-containing protein n=1 Tax=Thiopseudomonas alkaliphila TaxID=1697053 RepID=UPI00069E235C|nr:DUF3301 domain-containing protein [Thiopseudomonas alkaliphila]AKX53652.1 hypothetical protein AKN91_08235 [Thiopseudomonas alkaliphila]
MTLAKLTFWLLLVLAFAWLWRAHGVREKALAYALKTCTEQGVQLLDQNVAFSGWQRLRDANGRWRLARKYRFEFTVTAQERLQGLVFMYGSRPASCKLAPHPYPQSTPNSPPTYSQDYTQSKVVELAQWRTHNTTTSNKKNGD